MCLANAMKFMIYLSLLFFLLLVFADHTPYSLHKDTCAISKVKEWVRTASWVNSFLLG